MTKTSMQVFFFKKGPLYFSIFYVEFHNFEKILSFTSFTDTSIIWKPVPEKPNFYNRYFCNVDELKYGVRIKNVRLYLAVNARVLRCRKHL